MHPTAKDQATSSTSRRADVLGSIVGYFVSILEDATRHVVYAEVLIGFDIPPNKLAVPSRWKEEVLKFDNIAKTLWYRERKVDFFCSQSPKCFRCGCFLPFVRI